MLVFSLQNLDLKLMDLLVRCANRLGIPSDRVRIQSHSESFAFYTVSQKLDIWANEVGLFDLTKEGLYFYKFTCVRGGRPHILRIQSHFLEEGFSLDLLDTEPGRKLADSILAPCAERMLQKRVFSAIFLSGQGMAECADWGKRFLRVVCNKRRAYMTENLFAKGAAYFSMDCCRAATQYPYRLDCQGRLEDAVCLEVVSKGLERKLILAENGANWYDAKAHVEILVDGKEPVELLLETDASKGIPTRRIPVSLADFPAREGYTTRVALSISFASEQKMIIEVKDLGFGQIFPSSGCVSRQEVMLNTVSR